LLRLVVSLFSSAFCSFLFLFQTIEQEQNIKSYTKERKAEKNAIACTLAQSARKKKAKQNRKIQPRTKKEKNQKKQKKVSHNKSNNTNKQPPKKKKSSKKKKSQLTLQFQ